MSKNYGQVVKNDAENMLRQKPNIIIVRVYYAY